MRGDGAIAFDVFLYVHDVRPYSDTYEDFWQASREFASKCSYYRVQTTARKMKSPVRRPDPWTGTMIYTELGVEGLISHKKVRENSETGWGAGQVSRK